MFNGFKYNSAVAAAVAKMRANGQLKATEVKAMADIAMRGVNLQYGKALIASGAAHNPAAAAASVFSRMAVATSPSSITVPSWLWAHAARVAMENAGATPTEAAEIVKELMVIERNAGWGSAANSHT